MFLTFNENIQSGYGYIQKADYIGTAAPTLFSQTNSATKASAQTFSLTFDAPVQSATGGSFEVYNYRDGATSPKTARSDSFFVGNKVIFKPAATLASATSYYIKIVDQSAIRSSANVGMGSGAIDTKSYTGHGVTASVQ